MKKVFSFIAIAFLTAALALGALGCRDRQSLIDQAAARQNGTPPDETEQPSPTPELTDEPEIELQTSEPKGKPISIQLPHSHLPPERTTFYLLKGACGFPPRIPQIGEGT